MKITYLIFLALSCFLLASCSHLAVEENKFETEAFEKEMEKLAKGLNELDKEVARIMPYPLGAFEVTIDNSIIYAGATKSADIVAYIPKGVSLPIIDKLDGWYAIDFSDVESIKKNENYDLMKPAGWINAEVGVPFYYAISPEELSRSVENVFLKEQIKTVIDEQIKKITDFLREHGENEIFKATGFSLSLGFGAVDFEFK